MQFNQFPCEYEEKRKSAAQDEESAERSRSSEKRNTIRNAISETANVGNWTEGGATAGFFVGLFICFSMCASGGNSIGSAVLTWVIVSIAGAVLGAFLAELTNLLHNRSVKSAERKVEEERQNAEKAIENIHARAASESAAYKEKFEAEAQKMSVKYADSELATEVISWMTDGFVRTIDATDRREHVEIINVPFCFNVYTNKIACNLGTYDFEIKRCANLAGPLEQTAIARAIASAIQLNITMKYQKDVSGTAFSLSNSYSYTTDYVSVSVIYTAPNGNYRPVKNW